MPLVFVHGVNVRRGQSYAEEEILRDSLFRRFLLDSIVPDPMGTAIHNPYWGDHASRFRWNYASLPGSDVETLGGDDQIAAKFFDEDEVGQKIEAHSFILNKARKSLEVCIDLLWEESTRGISADQAVQLANLAEYTTAYVQDNKRPLWMAQVHTDGEFIARLQLEVDNWRRSRPGTEGKEKLWEALGTVGPWDRIREAAGRIRGAAGSVLSSVGVQLGRTWLHKKFSTFLGDVFVYLNERGQNGSEGAVVKEIASAIQTAKDRGPLDRPEPLIVVAHSMGGNIVYDILTHFRPALAVDILITVGSQVAMFEELKLFKVSDPSIPVNPKSDRIPKPTNVGRWINVFDENDILGFAAEGVFSGVKDFKYSTGRGVLGSHSNYFTWPSFHDRLKRRLEEANA